MKPLYATQHEARLIASLPEGGTGMICREVKGQDDSPILDSRPTGDGYDISRWVDAKGILRHPPRFGDCPIDPPHPIGAVLAVKEAWAQWESDANWGVYYRADRGDIVQVTRWSPSASMPKCAVRSYIRITGLRVARAPDFTADEAAQWMRTYEGHNPPQADRYQWLYAFEKASREAQQTT